MPKRRHRRIRRPTPAAHAIDEPRREPPKRAAVPLHIALARDGTG